MKNVIYAFFISVFAYCILMVVSVFGVPVSNLGVFALVLLYELFIGIGVFFIVKATPGSFWYVPIIANVCSYFDIYKQIFLAEIIPIKLLLFLLTIPIIIAIIAALIGKMNKSREIKTSLVNS